MRVLKASRSTLLNSLKTAILRLFSLKSPVYEKVIAYHCFAHLSYAILIIKVYSQIFTVN